VAVTHLLVSSTIVQSGLFPLQAPDHLTKVEPLSGAAVKVTAVPDGNTVPEGLVVTNPLPEPFLLIFRERLELLLTTLANVAEMLWFALTLLKV
jgi:hypothetical protein